MLEALPGRGHAGFYELLLAFALGVEDFLFPSLGGLYTPSGPRALERFATSEYPPPVVALAPLDALSQQIANLRVAGFLVELLEIFEFRAALLGLLLLTAVVGERIDVGDVLAQSEVLGGADFELFLAESGGYVCGSGHMLAGTGR